MADKQLPSGAVDSSGTGAEVGLNELWHDNGDGSFARTHWVGATITATIGSLQIPDGQDVAEGAKADAVVQGDTAGSVSAKLRGVNKVLGAIADAAWTTGSGSVVALLKAVAGLLAHGQATMANSVPVTIASDQSALPITSTDVGFYTRIDTFTAAANGVTVDAHLTPGLAYSLQVKGTGATPTHWNVVLEGSLDNANWTTILSHIDTTPTADGATVNGTAHPYLYFRTRCVSITLGSATNVVATLLALR